MQIKFTLLFAVVFFSVNQCLYAGIKLSNVTAFESKAFKPIISNNQVKGYSLLFTFEAPKQPKETMISLYDENLKKKKSIKLPKDKSENILLNNCYNNEDYAFLMLNPEKNKLELSAYDNELVKKFTATSTLNPKEISNLKTNTKALSEIYGLYDIPNVGFLKKAVGEELYQITLQRYDNLLKPKWKYNFKSFLDKIQTKAASFYPYQITEKYICGLLTTSHKKKGSVLQFEFANYLVVIDVETGKPLFIESINETIDEELSINTVKFDETKSEFIVVGEYYKAGTNAMSSKSIGFYIKEYGLDGKSDVNKKFAWDGEFKDALPAEAVKSDDEDYQYFMHEVLRDDKQNHYLVLEQFKKMVSGKGIAKNVGGLLLSSAINSATGGVVSYHQQISSSVEGKIGNMFIVKLNSENKLEAVNFFDKTTSRASLPFGSELLPSGLIGYALKSVDGFDYKYCTETGKKDKFQLYYVNYDRKSETGGDKFIGIITKDEEGNMNRSTIDITEERKSDNYIYPAIENKVVLVTYYFKEKEVDIKFLASE